jgi:hypothetical protein
MIKDFFISFRENFKEKTANPFLGTYIVVWLIRNWELAYSVFNFDDDYLLSDKVQFVKNYYYDVSLFTEVTINILITFLVLIISYLLINVSRLIINFFEKIVTPLVYKWTDKSSIVLKSELLES